MLSLRSLLVTTSSTLTFLALNACGSVVTSPPGTTGDPSPSDPSAAESLTDRPLGAACAFDSQCKSARCTADPEAGTCGQCVDPQPLGAFCAGALQGCSITAVCKDGVCQTTHKGPGETCSMGPKGEDLNECDQDLYCAHDENDWTHGTCAARVPVGGACDSFPANCVMGAYCDQNGHCVLPVPGSCLGTWRCDDGRYCAADFACRTPTLAEGDACGLVDGSFVDNDCADGLVCGSITVPNGVDGPDSKTTCVALPLAGEHCQRDRCAPGLFCVRPPDDGSDLPRCAPKKGEGDACDNGSYYPVTCAEGLECRDSICQPACR
ncbi:MAG: hypothetical protein U0359_34320 [Byssovorax sp.]